MKCRQGSVIAAIMTLVVALSAISAAAQQGIEGSWQGTLSVPGAKLKIVFNIARADGGHLTATMDSPDQGAKGIPIDEATFSERHLSLKLNAIGGSFEGDLAPDNGSLAGNWKQGGMSFPLTLSRAPASTEAAPQVEFKKSGSSDAKDIRGNWLGTISFSGVPLKLIVKITMDSAGVLHAALDSPDQGATDIPVDETTFQAGHLHLASKSIGGALEGDLSEDLSTISATWSQASLSLPLELKRTDTVITYNRPQEPKPPFPYDEREVSYVNKEAGDTLAGTLTLPRSGGKFPAVLLITGSGRQDRNEALLGHKPFLVLADYLTRRGIAVLRVDDRGVGKSTGNFRKSTSLDFLSDVLSGVEYLKQLPEINPRKIGLIGHSEGGMLAPMAAAKSPDVAFIVLMAGPGVPGKDLLLLQQELIERAQGIGEEAIARNGKIQQAVLDVAMSTLDSSAATDSMRQVIKAGTAGMSDSEKQLLEYSADMIEVGIAQASSPWFRYFTTYDPRPTLEKVKCPVLAINGEKDLQVPPKQNLPAIAEALKKGHNKDVTTTELPGLNHLFQTAMTGSPDEYMKIEETISPTALALMGAWIVAHCK